VSLEYEYVIDLSNINSGADLFFHVPKDDSVNKSLSSALDTNFLPHKYFSIRLKSASKRCMIRSLSNLGHPFVLGMIQLMAVFYFGNVHPRKHYEWYF
jgi:hypothetical protein